MLIFILLFPNGSFSAQNYNPNPNPETGELKGTFAVITRPANELMRMIHNHGKNKHRMPLFMQPQQALQWLEEDMTDEDIKNVVGYEIPSAALEAVHVFPLRTTRPRPDGKEKFEKFDCGKLPPLRNEEQVEVQCALF